MTTPKGRGEPWPPQPSSQLTWPPVENGPYFVDIDWEMVDGRWEPNRITIAPRDITVSGPITTSMIRSLPFGQIFDYARGIQRRGSEQVAVEHGLDDSFAARWDRGERPRLGVDHYRKVADVYRLAFAEGRPPTKTVAEHFQVSTSTAGSWVSRARNKYGLLGETSSGEAGI